VENRRDPEFATMVQSAITTAAPLPAVSSGSAAAAFGALEADAPILNVEEELAWPPLRIAVVADATVPAVPEVVQPLSIESQRHDDVPHWSPLDRASTDHHAEDLLTEDQPILIVEDDNPSPKSPVRREEYRNLFSRLRSG
jgi:hypothetical protein